ncbi:MAG: c-type cytochrome [Acidobacteriaceae bacterium]|nr:c-type cytochrome [Acidobacteriaceae bacterium]
MRLRIATVALATITTMAWMQAAAEDGGALYKTKCAMCHGDQGQGKPSMGPKLAGTAKSVAEVASVLTKGGEAKVPHIKPNSTLTPAQAAAVAAYVKTLK